MKQRSVLEGRFSEVLAREAFARKQLDRVSSLMMPFSCLALALGYFLRGYACGMAAGGVVCLGFIIFGAVCLVRMNRACEELEDIACALGRLERSEG